MRARRDPRGHRREGGGRRPTAFGGTLLMSTLAYLAAKRDNRIKAATCFTTMLDFSEPGELEVFIDEEQIELIEKLHGGEGLSRRHRRCPACSTCCAPTT